ncbi:S-adenosyl-L-methionine-dependent methyltransferase [Mytilinidion resinicola]|uniref:S-adenosyl-L-methionine-dependent methyltransferase n=1 Tax=Mytilinidion resinicola TaxID=574789 RepID=A0A6A6YPQ8_9PEZI|nr:S-adenosyl-L-methionine-dependent methyltransferase [Mytilinidion resinicola]KAF2810004.1 S-adenosyl-L-methionine-dependent methyltransferase [Mytilinidion resinicola]
MAFAEANRKYFDSLAEMYDGKPWAKKIGEQLAKAFRSRRDWIGVDFLDEGTANSDKTVRLLDYACGTGMVSRALGPYVTTTIGIDISPNMVAAYNERATSSGFPKSQVSAVVGDLFAAEPSTALSGPEYFNFDLAVVSAGYHQFDDVVLCTKRLAERLKPGGVLVISDFLQGSDTDVLHTNVEGIGEHAHGHHHLGHSHHHGYHSHEPADLPSGMRAAIKVFAFDEAGVRAFFEEAGLVGFEMSVLEEKVHMEFGGKKMESTVFFAKGMKPKA